MVLGVPVPRSEMNEVRERRGWDGVRWGDWMIGLGGSWIGGVDLS